jgi:hypothetical protein
VLIRLPTDDAYWLVWLFCRFCSSALRKDCRLAEMLLPDVLESLALLPVALHAGEQIVEVALQGAQGAGVAGRAAG